MDRCGLSQSELARRIGVTQGAIAKIANYNPQGSSKLHLLARELGTTPAYLTGEVDDPAEGAYPAPPPSPPQIMLPVLLPSERALTRMFLGLLDLVDQSASKDELARELAQLLPTGLSQLRGQLFERSQSEQAFLEEAAAPHAIDDPVRQR